MHPALRKGPRFYKKTPPISFPSYGPVIAFSLYRHHRRYIVMVEGKVVDCVCGFLSVCGPKEQRLELSTPNSAEVLCM